MRVDKMTMAHSIEARVPFLDHDLVEFAMRLPPSYKLSDGIGKEHPQEDRRALRRSRPPLPPQAGLRGADGQVVPGAEFRQALHRRAGATPTSTARAILNREYIMGLLRGQVEGHDQLRLPSLDRHERRVLARALDRPAPGGRLSRQAHACSTPPTSPRSPRPAAPAGPARSAAKSMTFRRSISPPGSGAGIASLDGAAASTSRAPTIAARSTACG